MKQKGSQNQVNERAQHLLKALVEQYIRDGQPVGSKRLAEVSDLNVSSATIRNIMSELEDRGYVSSIHTSSGRVPTDRGYRYFVDSLLSVQPIDEQVIAQCQGSLNPDATVKTLVQSTSSLLSQMTHMAGIVTLPRRENPTLRHIEFLPLSNRRVLAILVVNQEEVQNHILHTDSEFDGASLQRAANYINQNCRGRPLSMIGHMIIEAMQADKAALTEGMSDVVNIATSAINDTQQEDYVVAGESNLIDIVTTSDDMDKVRHLLEAFNQKREILHLLDRCMSSDGVQIYIGKESGYEWFDACSVVSVPYRLDGDVVGVLGVVGPTRMDYERIVPMVDVTARLLSIALDGKKEQ